MIAGIEVMLAADRVHSQTQTVQCTVSTGKTNQPGTGIEDMLARADEALHRAKSEGLNRVVVD